MTHRLIGHLMLVVMTLAAACTGGAEEDGRPGPTDQGGGGPFQEVTRPIVDIVPAASIAEDGQPVDPGFVFAPDAPQVTDVAQVGEVSGSPM